MQRHTRLEAVENTFELTKMFFVGLGYTLPGSQFEGDFGEIIALGAKISPYIGLVSGNLPKKKKKKKKIFFFFLKFLSC